MKWLAAKTQYLKCLKLDNNLFIGEKCMSDKNIEMMKKLIEEKKKKGSQQGSNQRPDKSIGTSRVGRINKKQGGQFDK
jgi:hypothetical protein